MHCNPRADAMETTPTYETATHAHTDRQSRTHAQNYVESVVSIWWRHGAKQASAATVASLTAENIELGGAP